MDTTLFRIGAGYVNIPTTILALLTHKGRKITSVFLKSRGGDDVFDEVYVRILDEDVDEKRRRFNEKYEGTRVPPRKIRAFTGNVKQTT